MIEKRSLTGRILALPPPEWSMFGPRLWRSMCLAGSAPVLGRSNEHRAKAFDYFGRVLACGCCCARDGRTPLNRYIC